MPGPAQYPAGTPEAYMQECLQLAGRGLGWTSPNPLVGCVLVRDGVVIGRGWHAGLGGRHAEVMALEDCRANSSGPQGADCYASLEPCSHTGRQPPCCEALIAAGVRSVTIGCRDADPRSADRAQAILVGAGIAARYSSLERDCERFLDYYLLSKRQGRSFVHLKLALSLDARLACANGASQWLSGPQSHGLAHYLRQKYDAVLVGAGTVAADNPRLTVRPEVLREYVDTAELRPRDPLRVVLDPQFKLAAELQRQDSPIRLLSPSASARPQLPWLVLAGLESSLPATGAWPEGVVALGLRPGGEGRIGFCELAQRLYALGVCSLLVEGGAAVAQEILRQRAADKLTFVYTPRLIGREGLEFSPALERRSIDDCPRLADPQVEVLGADAAISGYPDWPADISALEER